MSQREVMEFLDDNNMTWYSAKDLFKIIYPGEDYQKRMYKLHRALKQIVKRDEYIKMKYMSHCSNKTIILYKAVEEELK